MFLFLFHAIFTVLLWSFVSEDRFGVCVCVCVCVFSVKMTVNLTTYFLESSNVCVAK